MTYSKTIIDSLFSKGNVSCHGQTDGQMTGCNSCLSLHWGGPRTHRS